MTDLILKVFIKDHNNTGDPKVRTKYGILSGCVGIALNVLLCLMKFFVGSVINVGGMKPNFIIAMYCLAILLIRPKLIEGIIIGLLAGIICQFFPGTPYINIASELLGAAAMVLLMKLPLKAGSFDLRPIVCTFLSTLVSGYA